MDLMKKKEKKSGRLRKMRAVTVGSVCVLVELWALHGDSSSLCFHVSLLLLPCVPALRVTPGEQQERAWSPSGGEGRDVGMLREIPAFNSLSISQQRKNLWFNRRKNPV